MAQPAPRRADPPRVTVCVARARSDSTGRHHLVHGESSDSRPRCGGRPATASRRSWSTRRHQQSRPPSDRRRPYRFPLLGLPSPRVRMSGQRERREQLLDVGPHVVSRAKGFDGTSVGGDRREGGRLQAGPSTSTFGGKEGLYGRSSVDREGQAGLLDRITASLVGDHPRELARTGRRSPSRLHRGAEHRRLPDPRPRLAGSRRPPARSSSMISDPHRDPGSSTCLGGRVSRAAATTPSSPALYSQALCRHGGAHRAGGGSDARQAEERTRWPRNLVNLAWKRFCRISRRSPQLRTRQALVGTRRRRDRSRRQPAVGQVPPTGATRYFKRGTPAEPLVRAGSMPDFRTGSEAERHPSTGCPRPEVGSPGLVRPLAGPTPPSSPRQGQAVTSPHVKRLKDPAARRSTCCSTAIRPAPGEARGRSSSSCPPDLQGRRRPPWTRRWQRFRRGPSASPSSRA